MMTWMPLETPSARWALQKLWESVGTERNRAGDDDPDEEEKLT